MSSVHLTAAGLGIIAGALFLLAAFGIDHLAVIAVVPLGLVFLVASLLVHHHPLP